MLKVEIENHLLNETIEFFFKMELTNGKQSRHRTRFVKLLNDNLERVAEEQDALIKEHCHLDEQGNPKQTEEGQYDFKDFEAFINDRTELYEEKVIIDDSNSQVMLMTIRDILDNYEGELSERKAVLYEHLCEAFKVDEELEDESE